MLRACHTTPYNSLHRSSDTSPIVLNSSPFFDSVCPLMHAFNSQQVLFYNLKPLFYYKNHPALIPSVLNRTTWVQLQYVQALSFHTSHKSPCRPSTTPIDGSTTPTDGPTTPTNGSTTPTDAKQPLPTAQQLMPAAQQLLPTAQQLLPTAPIGRVRSC